jgi:hypothetical protein
MLKWIDFKKPIFEIILFETPYMLGDYDTLKICLGRETLVCSL